MSYLGEAHEMPDSCCLACGHLLNAASGFDNNAHPKEGDVSLCVKCGHIAVFNTDGVLRQPTEAERSEALAMPGVRDVLLALFRLRSKWGSRS